MISGYDAPVWAILDTPLNLKLIQSKTVPFLEKIVALEFVARS